MILPAPARYLLINMRLGTYSASRHALAMLPFCGVPTQEDLEQLQAQWKNAGHKTSLVQVERRAYATIPDPPTARALVAERYSSSTYLLKPYTLGPFDVFVDTIPTRPTKPAQNQDRSDTASVFSSTSSGAWYSSTPF